VIRQRGHELTVMTWGMSARLVVQVPLCTPSGVGRPSHVRVVPGASEEDQRNSSGKKEGGGPETVLFLLLPRVFGAAVLSPEVPALSSFSAHLSASRPFSHRIIGACQSHYLAVGEQLCLLLVMP
jgi:hypothetical protein